MKFYSAESIRKLDARAIASGISGERLMGRASRALAEELLWLADRHPRPVVVLCGPGNNGGDGFGLAWHLHHQGWPVQCRLVVNEEKLRGDARLFYDRARADGVPMLRMDRAEDVTRAEVDLPAGAWIVDAILGTGVKEAPRDSAAAAIDFINERGSRHRVWAVDCPSGFDPDRGEPFDPRCCVRADFTLTLGAPKLGFEQDASEPWTGSITVLELGFSKEDLAEGAQGDWQVLSREQAARRLLPIHAGEHKGSRGHALLIGGSPGMSGAIILAARAALRCGCGRVSVLTPFTCAPAVDSAQAEVMVIPAQQGKFHALCGQDINYAAFQAAGIGPGMRANHETAELVTRALGECSVPLVLDADALNDLQKAGLEKHPALQGRWLTPHPAELGRLTGCPVADIQADRREAVCAAQTDCSARILLKGARSRMAQGGEDNWVNLNGGSALATAGSGDVLTGILTGLLARGVHHEHALPLAVYLHARAGDLAAMRNGNSGTLAGDVADALPAVFINLQGR